VAKNRDLSQDVYNLPAHNARVIIFDVDHTITRKNTVVRLAVVGLFTKVVPLSLLIRFPLYMLGYSLGKYTVDSIPRKLDVFEGIPVADLVAWAESTFDKKIENDIFPVALGVIRKLIAEGKHVVLATSSLDFVIRPLANHLGITDVVATELESDENGICTGEVKGSPAFGTGKVAKTGEFLARLGLTFQDAAFFSDSINDLPLLDKVAFPVPTNPDKRLLKASKERGWDTVSFKR